MARFGYCSFFSGVPGRPRNQKVTKETPPLQHFSKLDIDANQPPLQLQPWRVRGYSWKCWVGWIPNMPKVSLLKLMSPSTITSFVREYESLYVPEGRSCSRESKTGSFPLPTIMSIIFLNSFGHFSLSSLYSKLKDTPKEKVLR